MGAPSLTSPPFETKCELVLSKVSDLNKIIYLQAIVSQLNGKAFEAIRYQHITRRDELQLYFRAIYGNIYSISYLRKQLNSMKQYDNGFYNLFFHTY